jgi:hypothetical protein
MKKIIFTLITLCFALNSIAQEHLTFKGIPIEGSMTSFCQKLKSKGLKQVATKKNVTLFLGDFTGRDAKIAVGATDDGKNVHSVVVMFDPSEEWNTLTNTYDYFKELYTHKYGEPEASVENNPANSDSNISKMAELHQGTVTWASAWEVTGGIIELSIKNLTEILYEGMVVICYRDKQNIENKIQNDLDEI